MSPARPTTRLWSQAAATRSVSRPLEQPDGALLGLEQLKLRLGCQRGRRSVSSRDSWSEHRGAGIARWQ
eukprot:3830137-Pleurochrysis_carterae.AAC.2